MGYEHTQRGPWHWLLFAVGAGFVVGSWEARQDPTGHYVCLGVALLMIIVGFSFMHLTVRDEQDALAVRYGPLPLWSTRIPYERIRAVAKGRTTLLDGWGVHYFPGRGTTYNIWGFTCVRIDCDRRRTLRIGTDDAEQLLEFLESRLPETAESANDQ